MDLKQLELGARVIDDGYNTHTSHEQKVVESACETVYEKWANIDHVVERALLLKPGHLQFAGTSLQGLSAGFTSLDASRPWMVYWALHSMDLLCIDAPPELRVRVIEFLRRCQHPQGGFGGGPGQEAHLAPTFAAVCALLTLGGNDAYEVIDRRKLHDFLIRMKTHHGGFMVHEGGEVDTRGAYTALVVASMCNILTPHLAKNCATWLRSCQTYEGGMGGEPGNEAHGGYTFCGLAAMILLNKEELLDLDSMLHWAARRQLAFEGGFQGRTNKLVDGCYSYWVGALFPLLEMIINKQSSSPMPTPTPTSTFSSHLFDEEALQRYILLCCQEQSGGLRDKPGKRPDLYHTCYTLSGLAVAQEYHAAHAYTSGVPPFPQNGDAPAPRPPYCHRANILRANNALYNITNDKLTSAMAYFNSQPRVDVQQQQQQQQ